MAMTAMATIIKPGSKILVGLSGGVDSTVASLLLKEQGWQVTGLSLLFSDAGLTALEDARFLSDQLAIPWSSMDVRQTFNAQIVDAFCAAYQAGQTPNPCIFCNPRIKMAALLREADRIGCLHIATGHYARIVQNPDNGRLALARSSEDWKDQSYFLYRLSQEQLARLVFPLAGLDKASVRARAAQAGLLGQRGEALAHRPDSQDICFIPNNDYAQFIADHVPESWKDAPNSPFLPGPVIDRSGRQIGTHDGLIRYTVGQRKGFHVRTTDRLFVIAKIPDSNSLLVGPYEDVLQREILVGDVVLSYLDAITPGEVLDARIRNSAREAPCLVYPLPDGRLRVLFETPVAAPAAGQSCVFYRGGIIQAGGIILPRSAGESTAIARQE
jgi:tRNA-uridine 2-sulfurtransferase